MDVVCGLFCFFFKQKTAYELRISDWSSDVCSSDLAISRACARLPPHCQSGGEAAALCQRSIAYALCLSRRCPSTGSQPHPRRNRVVLDLACNRDLVAVRPKSRHCTRTCRRALGCSPWADGGGPVPTASTDATPIAFG